ncbi:DNA-processing protein DprA [Arcanobacterium hippocoleae]|uniref:DNA processing protein n=1 Tax=Arcanobacterium hippocoleae TaxID=149017 RepID=A0ABU1T149_9ACTO|nr:DNA-processing protein DprA [Arcanobacterium hippocoleae]MDR6939092.1 DNA processing protein [Arcanobacterium hippocoleae]
MKPRQNIPSRVTAETGDSEKQRWSYPSGLLAEISEQRAALVWSAIAEGDDLDASRLIDRVGYAAALKVAQEQDENFASPRALQRWQGRLCDAQLGQLEHYLQLGFALVLRDQENWPKQLNDLGEKRPLCLWVKGNVQILQRPMLAIVGSRDATSEGERSALDLAYELAEKYVIVSGGAFGIDAQAHRGAILANQATVIVSAAGVDRVYPKQNQEIFTRCVENGGAIISESIPGASPQRYRFLLRNRIIAALSTAVIVIEAGARSGALNTARHALEIGREVGAFPGSVYCPQASGTNQLLRNGAMAVMNSLHVQELAGSIGSVQPELAVSDGEAGFLLPLDSPFDELADRVYDVLSKVKYESAEQISRRVGADFMSVRMKLSRLALAGKAQMQDGKWRKA